MNGRFKRAAPRASIGTIALAVLAIGATSGVASSSSAAAASTSPSASVLAPIHGRYNPDIDAANFVRRVDNPYFPLVPGTGFHFKGVSGTTPQADNAVVLHKTKRILGIDATVVRDEVSEHGTVIERTFDHYAQDKQGNVWYVGELALERQHGRLVKASDSWQAGVNGAKPGIIMPAHPRRGDAYRQEFSPANKALDEARVLDQRGSVTVPAGTFKRVLVTLEGSPLERQKEKKYYVAGVGEVKEQAVKGLHEVFDLISVTH